MKRPSEQQQLLEARVRLSWLVLFLWVVFATGLLVQVAAPRLKIENRAFVVPPISDARGPVLRPEELVRRARWMQFFLGVFTVGGAIALGVCYRGKLLTALKG